jgi:hypothetical protein
MKDALNELKNEIPSEIVAANDLAKNPTNKAVSEQLTKANDKVGRFVILSRAFFECVH